MSKTLVLVISAITLIVMAALFGIHFGPDTVVSVPASAAGNALYVCPADSGSWATAARALVPFRRYIILGFFCCAMLLAFSWVWALYQNLLKDKFERNAYSNAWKGTKLLFWAVVIFVILSATPNHFRSVSVRGHGSNWVLCENNTPGARPVYANAVSK